MTWHQCRASLFDQNRLDGLRTECYPHLLLGSPRAAQPAAATAPACGAASAAHQTLRRHGALRSAHAIAGGRALQYLVEEPCIRVTEEDGHARVHVQPSLSADELADRMHAPGSLAGKCAGSPIVKVCIYLRNHVLGQFAEAHRLLRPLGRLHLRYARLLQARSVR